MSKHLPARDLLNTTSSPDVCAVLIDDFRSYLVARGYAVRTLHLYCSVAVHFMHWLGAPLRIDAQSVSHFLHVNLHQYSDPMLVSNVFKDGP